MVSGAYVFRLTSWTHGALFLYINLVRREPKGEVAYASSCFLVMGALTFLLVPDSVKNLSIWFSDIFSEEDRST